MAAYLVNHTVSSSASAIEDQKQASAGGGNASPASISSLLQHSSLHIEARPE